MNPSEWTRRGVLGWLTLMLLILVVPLAVQGCGGTKTVTRTVVQPPTAAINKLVDEGKLVPADKIKLGPESGARPDGYKAAAPPSSVLRTLTGSQIHLSHRGAVLIEGFEGWASCPYWDAYGGVWTRGYGETEGIHAGSACISRSFGERNLIYRAERFYGFAIKRLGTSFNQNEIDAQFSFLWNLGAGIDPPGSTLARGFQHHNASGILGYDRAGGVVLAGLVTRRQAEYRRFNEPAHEETQAQRRARIHNERVAKLHHDYHYRSQLDRALKGAKCLHGYDHYTKSHRRFCNVERARHGATNRDIKRLRALGIR